MIYKLIVDELVGVWRRSKVRVNANSFEEAVEECKQNGTDNISSIIDSEYLDETECYFEQNELNPITIEVRDEHCNLIANNDYQ